MIEDVFFQVIAGVSGVMFLAFLMGTAISLLGHTVLDEESAE